MIAQGEVRSSIDSERICSSRNFYLFSVLYNISELCQHC